MKAWRLLGRVTAGLALIVLPLVCRLAGAEEQPSRSEQIKPVLVVTFSGLDRLLEDADFIGKVVGTENLGDTVKMFLSQQTGEAGVPGVDPKRPCGVLVQTDGFQFLVCGYVPVSDLRKTLDWLKQKDLEFQQEGDVWSVELPNGQTLYAVQKGNWAVLAADKQVLGIVEAAPPAEFDSLAQKYDLGLSVHLTNIPPMFKQLAVGMIQQGIEMGLQQAAESGQDVEEQRKMAQYSLRQIQEVMDEVETLAVGLNVNDPAAAVALELVTVPRPGTQYAQGLAANRELKTRLGGFVVPGATLMIRETAKASERDIEEFRTIMPKYRAMLTAPLDKDEKMSKREKELAKNLINTILDSVQATVEKGTLDLAGSLHLSDQQCELVAGSILADAGKVEAEILKILKEAMKAYPEAQKHIRLNAETYQGYRFHTVTVPESEMEDAPEGLRKILGDRFSIVLAFSDEALCMAAGPDAVGMLKKAIDTSAQETAVDKLVEVYVALRPLLQFVALVTEEEDARQTIQNILEAVTEKDRVRLEGTITGEKAVMRLEIEEGVMKCIAEAVKAGMKAKAESGAPAFPLPTPQAP